MRSMLEKQLIELVKKLLNEKKIDLFVGYCQGSMPLSATPCFITKPEEAEKLVFNHFCSANLAVYIPRLFSYKTPRKIGIVTKGCDNRSVVGLVKEKQVPREQLVIVGVNCPGVIDAKKILTEGVTGSVEDGDSVVVEEQGKGKQPFKINGILAEMCSFCQHSSPVMYDHLLGEKRQAKPVKKDERFENFKKKPAEERWRYFISELSKCIRCNACRQACPNCYCRECFADQLKPKWAGESNNIADVVMYTLGRIFHQAGRCVDCGACVRACPKDIDLRIFTYLLVEDVKELFGSEAGISEKDLPALSVFKADDNQDFITEP